MLILGDTIADQILHQKMMKYSLASARESDGTENRVIMNGKAGSIGYTHVFLSYLEDGFIHLWGSNKEDRDGWKFLSQFELETGNYSLTGITGGSENMVALQLRIDDHSGLPYYIYQWDEDVTFTIENTAMATLHVRVYPFVDSIDMIARPGVYKNE